ncbi:MAG: hypothetical protein E7372_02830 [Clostridiales bacterium]|nr:hypothetical protein [Clostridiales bacterium]
MIEEGKSLKQYCKEAKKRLKGGFWQSYQKNLNENIERAEREGISTSKVKQYYTERVIENIKNRDEEKEEFYKKVKKLLLEEGEVPNAIGRLTDIDLFNSLSYEERQRYTLSLSEKYLEAVERFRKEQALNIKK